jgi:hypothetical protein
LDSPAIATLLDLRSRSESRVLIEPPIDPELAPR